MSDPVDQIRDLIDAGGPGVLSEIAKVLGFDDAAPDAPAAQPAEPSTAPKVESDALDAARWRNLKWYWDAERDMGPGGRWWCALLVNAGKPTVNEAIDIAMKEHRP